MSVTWVTVPTVMTIDEARSPHRSRCLVLHRPSEEAQHAVIASVVGRSVRCAHGNRFAWTWPENLTLLAGQGTEAGERLTVGDLVAAPHRPPVMPPPVALGRTRVVTGFGGPESVTSVA